MCTGVPPLRGDAYQTMRITPTILFLALVLTGCETTTSSVKSESDEAAIEPQDTQGDSKR
jgi:hypothetical protein